MSKPPFLDDLAELAGGAMSVFSSFRDQLQNETKERMDQMVAKLDLVTRDEFTKLQGMITKARLTQEEILQRLAALEGKKAKAAPPKKTEASVAKKPTPKKATAKAKPKRT